MLKLAWKYMRYYKSQTFAIFASILLTASLLSGISSLIYSSQKSDLANSKTIYGDWHYYIETDKELFNNPITSMVVAESKLPVGSSQSRILGLFAKALAIATLCC